jgi:hydroxyacylglutathione hydrolase
MIIQRKKNLWQFEFDLFGSSVYLFKTQGKNILIDTSSLLNRSELIEDLKKIGTPMEKIDIVILTHSHFDHMENMCLFKNAKIFGSKKDFSQKDIIDIKKIKLSGIKIIETPGHSKGSVCAYFPKEKILFSGDTIFFDNGIGRTDFSGGSEKEMESSLKKLKKLKYGYLCPGHSSRNQLNKLLSDNKL